MVYSSMNPAKIRAAYDAAWVCTHCGRPCRISGQPINLFIAELGHRVDDCLVHPRRYTLQVVHCDRNKNNFEPRNLKPLCQPCATRFHLLFRKRPIHTRRRRYV